MKKKERWLGDYSSSLYFASTACNYLLILCISNTIPSIMHLIFHAFPNILPFGRLGPPYTSLVLDRTGEEGCAQTASPTGPGSGGDGVNFPRAPPGATGIPHHEPCPGDGGGGGGICPGVRTPPLGAGWGCPGPGGERRHPNRVCTLLIGGGGVIVLFPFAALLNCLSQPVSFAFFFPFPLPAPRPFQPRGPSEPPRGSLLLEPNQTPTNGPSGVPVVPVLLRTRDGHAVAVLRAVSSRAARIPAVVGVTHKGTNKLSNYSCPNQFAVLSASFFALETVSALISEVALRIGGAVPSVTSETKSEGGLLPPVKLVCCYFVAVEIP